MIINLSKTDLEINSQNSCHKLSQNQLSKFSNLTSICDAMDSNKNRHWPSNKNGADASIDVALIPVRPKVLETCTINLGEGATAGAEDNFSWISEYRIQREKKKLPTWDDLHNNPISSSWRLSLKYLKTNPLRATIHQPLFENKSRKCKTATVILKKVNFATSHSDYIILNLDKFKLIILIMKLILRFIIFGYRG